MKKSGKKWIAMALVLSLIPISGAAVDSGRAAQAASEITSRNQADLFISSLEEFKDFVKSVNAGDDFSERVVRLTKDMDYGDKNVTVELVESEFSGTFDGAGHAIKGVKIHGGSVFKINSGTIKNLRLEDATLVEAGPVGGIAGTNYGTIDHCITGEDVSILFSNSDEYTAGGICGVNYDTIVNCCNRAEVALTTAAHGRGKIGGIVGNLDGGSIYNSGNTGRVYANDASGTGGLAGNFTHYSDGSDGKIKNCYNVGDIQGGTYSGAFAGNVHTSSSKKGIDTCYAKAVTDEEGNQQGFVGREDYEDRCVNCEVLSDDEMRSEGFVAKLNGYSSGKDGWKEWALYDDFAYPVPKKQYAITFLDGNKMQGVFSVESDYTYAGSEVEITVRPDVGYQCDSVMVKQEDGSAVPCTERNGKYSFVMPESPVNITGEFSETEDLSAYASIRLEETEKLLKMGESFELAAEIVYNDESWEEISPSQCAYKTSDPSVAKVSDDGVVTAMGHGTASVTVTYKDLSAVCTVTVQQSKLQLNATAKKMRVYGSFYLTAVLQDPDEDDWEVPSDSCQYSGYNSSIISVSQTGKVTAKKFGSTSVKVSYRGVTASCAVTVEKPRSLVVTSSVKLAPGYSCTLAPCFLYADGTRQSMASYCTYKNGNKKALSLSGRRITAIGVNGGSAKVTASCLGMSANCKVTLAKLSLSRRSKTVKLPFGRRFSLPGNVKSNAANSFLKQKVTWKSSKKKTVAVLSGGRVKAKKSGSSTITAYVGGKKRASFKVSVPKVSIRYKKSKRTIDYETSTYFTAKVDNVKYKGKKPLISIKSAKSSKTSVATVSYSGRTVWVYGHNHGTARIRVKFNNGKKKTLRISVRKPSVDQMVSKQKAYATAAPIYEDYDGGYYTTVNFYNNFPKNITYVKYSLLEYDNRGIRLKDNKRASYYKHVYNDTVGYSASESIYTSWDVRKVRVCISKVWFEDGRTWTNPAYKRWYKKYKKKYGKD